MARASVRFCCNECGAFSAKWQGRCPGCGAWNTLEESAPPLRGASRGASFPSPQPLAAVDPEGARAWETGLGELDRVLGGGFVGGSVTLLYGEPGIGKSTLALQVAAAAGRGGLSVLYVAAEESAAQVSRRAARLDARADGCQVVSTTDLASAVAATEELRPDLLVIDSVQALADSGVASPSGSAAQVASCAGLLARLAKAEGPATVLVGHVTKDGALAGPRSLEHLVDTVLAFEGDRHHALRSLVATKHRYGPAGEVGMFEMGPTGLRTLSDPSALLLSDRRPGATGSVAFAHAEGRRSLLLELQALHAESRAGAPRRVVHGMSPSRVALLLAVLEKEVGPELSGGDVFVSAVGGVRVTEPAADLPLCLALASSLEALPLDENTVVFGEVGLTGEVRTVPNGARRLEEAARLGFARAIVPTATPEAAGVRLERVSSLAEALAASGLALASTPRLRAVTPTFSTQVS